MAGQIPDDNKSVHWNTPEKVLAPTREVLGRIELDPCSNPGSIVKAEVEYQLPNQDGLHEPWNGSTIYVNPPYGRTFLHKEKLTILDPREWKHLTPEQRLEYHDTSIEDWIQKATETAQNGSSVIMLVPAYVNSSYFHKYIFKYGQAIAYPKGRVTFLGATSTAYFHLCVPYFGSNPHKFQEVFERHSYSVTLLQPKSSDATLYKL